MKLQTLVPAIGTIISLLFCPPARAAANRPADPIRRPAWGHVVGFVLDAESGRPLAGAAVHLPVDHHPAALGRAVGTTDVRGRFVAQCPLGRSHTSFRWARLLTAPLISFVISPRSLVPRSRAIDLDRLPVQVDAPGYKPYQGLVNCAAVVTSRFSATLEPVLLEPTDSPLRSFALDHYRWEEVTQFDVKPPGAHPGDRVVVTLTMRHVEVPGVKYVAGVESPHGLLGQDALRLPQKRVSEDGTEITYRGEFRLDPSARYNHEALSPIVVRDGEEVAISPLPHRLLQMVPKADHPDGAEEAAQVFRTADAGRYDEALKLCLDSLRSYPNDAMLHTLAGKLLLRFHRADEAVPHLEAALDRQPLPLSDAYPDYAEAMIALDRAPEALRRLQADRDRLEASAGAHPSTADTSPHPERKPRANDRSKKAPPQLWLALGNTALADGDLDLAETAIGKASTGVFVPARLRVALALRRSEAALVAAPGSVQTHIRHARALDDAGRTQAALDEYRNVVQMDGALPWQRLDLAEALLRDRQQAAAVPVLESVVRDAPANLEAHRALADAYRQTGRNEDAVHEYAQVLASERGDFQALHWTGVLQMAEGHTDLAEETLTRAVAAAHSKPHSTEGAYFSPMDFLVGGPEDKETTGFQDDRAGCDWQVLDAMAALKQRPDDALALFALGNGLLNAGCPSAAVDPLQKAVAADSLLLDAQVDLGLVSLRTGDLDAARRLLTEAARLAPASPPAAHGLAELLAQTDGLAASERALAAYRRVASGAASAEAAALAQEPEEDRPWTDRLN